MTEVTETSINLSVQYLLAELPVWLNLPYLLDVPSAVLVYKDLSDHWKRICYQYGLLSSDQAIWPDTHLACK